MIWARLFPVRRRAALWLCPELAQATQTVVRIAPRNSGPVQVEIDQVLRLGEALLARDQSKTFLNALGYGKRPVGMPLNDPVRFVYTHAYLANETWKRLRDNPPAKIRPETYQKLMAFFTKHWPADLPWPADIPRPARVRSEGAA